MIFIKKEKIKKGAIKTDDAASYLKLMFFLHFIIFFGE